MKAFFITLVGGFFLITLIFRIAVIIWAKISQQAAAPPAKNKIGLVFGAGLEKNGTPSRVLSERVDTAVQLWQNGTIQEIVMSGGNRGLYYNEPLAMKLQALSAGIPNHKIQMDHDGFRSFDSCVNLKRIAGGKNVVLITQAFHLPRILMISKIIRLNAAGFAAAHEMHNPFDMLWWHLREIPATLRALYDSLRWRRLNKSILERSENG